MEGGVQNCLLVCLLGSFVESYLCLFFVFVFFLSISLLLFFFSLLQGYYVEPTVITDVNDSMKVFQDEIFGPVMTIARFSSVDEVVKRANDTKFGLAAGVFTQDVTKGYEVASKLRSGMVFWNCYHVVDIAAPFGGMKESGFGREGGEYGLQPYLEVKNVVLRVTK